MIVTKSAIILIRIIVTLSKLSSTFYSNVIYYQTTVPENLRDPCGTIFHAYTSCSGYYQTGNVSILCLTCSLETHCSKFTRFRLRRNFKALEGNSALTSM